MTARFEIRAVCVDGVVRVVGWEPTYEAARKHADRAVASLLWRDPDIVDLGGEIGPGCD